VLIPVALLIGFEIFSPRGKEERLVISGEDATGRASWEFYAAARGVICTHYEYFPTPVAIPTGIDRQKWERDLAENNSGYEHHALWSVGHRIPVFPKNQPPLDSVAYRDLFVGNCTEYEIQREAIVIPGLIGFVIVGLSVLTAIKRLTQRRSSAGRE